MPNEPKSTKKFQDPIAKSVQMNRLLQKAESTSPSGPFVRARSQMKDSGSQSRKTEDLKAEPIPKYSSQLDFVKSKKNVFPQVNNFHFLKKGEGMGKNFLFTQTNFCKGGLKELNGSLSRTF